MQQQPRRAGDGHHGHHGRCASAPRMVAYEASAMERAWTESSAAGRICELMNTTAQMEGANVWMNFTSATWREAQPGVAQSQPDADAQTVLSKFVYDDGSIEFVEPLTGVARSHRAPVGCRPGDAGVRYKNPAKFAQIFDIRYLLPGNACGPSPGPRVGCHRKARFYDLGCTTYNGHKHDFVTKKLDYQAGGRRVGGPSVPLFSEFYRRRCLSFDEVYAWDSSKDKHQEPENWYADVPSELRDKIHYFNVPITFEQAPPLGQIRRHENHTAWRQYAQSGDLFNTLLATATPNDFVVLKLDIEGQTGSPEVAIAEVLAARPDLLRLVDEFYFEYHFYFDGKNFGWGNNPKPSASHPFPDVDSALKLMSRLRRAGVRAHFWI